MTIHIGKHVKTMKNYFLDENYLFSYDEECNIDTVEQLATYWDKIDLFQNPDQKSYEIYFPTNANLVKEEAVKLGFPPKYQDPIIPETNIYIPSGVKNIESHGIYIDAVVDERMDQTVYINIYLESNSVPSSWSSDWCFVNKSDTEGTYNKTQVKIQTGVVF